MNCDECELLTLYGLDTKEKIAMANKKVHEICQAVAEQKNIADVVNQSHMLLHQISKAAKSSELVDRAVLLCRLAVLLPHVAATEEFAACYANIDKTPFELPTVIRDALIANTLQHTRELLVITSTIKKMHQNLSEGEKLVYSKISKGHATLAVAVTTEPPASA